MTQIPDRKRICPNCGRRATTKNELAAILAASRPAFDEWRRNGGVRLRRELEQHSTRWVSDQIWYYVTVVGRNRTTGPVVTTDPDEWRDAYTAEFGNSEEEQQR
jgi:hypothetical protein